MQIPSEVLLEQIDEIEKRIGLTLSYIKYPPDTFPTVSCFKVCADDVVDVGEVPGLQAIPMNFKWLSSISPTDEARYDARILGGRVLSWSKDIEITKADRFKSVKLGEDLQVVFTTEL